MSYKKHTEVEVLPVVDLFLKISFFVVVVGGALQVRSNTKSNDVPL